MSNGAGMFGWSEPVKTLIKELHSNDQYGMTLLGYIHGALKTAQSAGVTCEEDDIFDAHVEAFARGATSAVAALPRIPVGQLRPGDIILWTVIPTELFTGNSTRGIALVMLGIQQFADFVFNGMKPAIDVALPVDEMRPTQVAFITLASSFMQRAKDMAHSVTLAVQPPMAMGPWSQDEEEQRVQQHGYGDPLHALMGAPQQEEMSDHPDLRSPEQPYPDPQTPLPAHGNGMCDDEGDAHMHSPPGLAQEAHVQSVDLLPDINLDLHNLADVAGAEAAASAWAQRMLLDQQADKIAALERLAAEQQELLAQQAHALALEKEKAATTADQLKRGASMAVSLTIEADKQKQLAEQARAEAHALQIANLNTRGAAEQEVERARQEVAVYQRQAEAVEAARAAKVRKRQEEKEARAQAELDSKAAEKTEKLRKLKDKHNMSDDDLKWFMAQTEAPVDGDEAAQELLKQALKHEVVRQKAIDAETKRLERKAKKSQEDKERLAKKVKIVRTAPKALSPEEKTLVEAEKQAQQVLKNEEDEFNKNVYLAVRALCDKGMFIPRGYEFNVETQHHLDTLTTWTNTEDRQKLVARFVALGNGFMTGLPTIFKKFQASYMDDVELKTYLERVEAARDIVRGSDKFNLQARILKLTKELNKTTTATPLLMSDLPEKRWKKKIHALLEDAGLVDVPFKQMDPWVHQKKSRSSVLERDAIIHLPEPDDLAWQMVAAAVFNHNKPPRDRSNKKKKDEDETESDEELPPTREGKRKRARDDSPSSSDTDDPEESSASASAAPRAFTSSADGVRQTNILAAHRVLIHAEEEVFTRGTLPEDIDAKDLLECIPRDIRIKDPVTYATLAKIRIECHKLARNTADSCWEMRGANAGRVPVSPPTYKAKQKYLLLHCVAVSNARLPGFQIDESTADKLLESYVARIKRDYDSGDQERIKAQEARIHTDVHLRNIGELDTSLRKTGSEILGAFEKEDQRRGTCSTAKQLVAALGSDDDYGRYDMFQSLIKVRDAWSELARDAALDYLQKVTNPPPVQSRECYAHIKPRATELTQVLIKYIQKASDVNMVPAECISDDVTLPMIKRHVIAIRKGKMTKDAENTELMLQRNKARDDAERALASARMNGPHAPAAASLPYSST